MSIMNAKEPARGEKPVVLLVEDTATFRAVVALKLRMSGVAVACAGNGQEALEALESSRPDLVLFDVAMPVLDGVGLLRAIRADDRWKALPAIAMSAGTDERRRNELEGLGIRGYFLKSTFTMDQLADAVAQSLATTPGCPAS